LIACNGRVFPLFSNSQLIVMSLNINNSFLEEDNQLSNNILQFMVELTRRWLIM